MHQASSPVIASVNPILNEEHTKLLDAEGRCSVWTVFEYQPSKYIHLDKYLNAKTTLKNDHYIGLS